MLDGPGVVSHPDVVHIHKLGACGQYPGNVRRDLFRRYTKKESIPKPIKTRVQIENVRKQLEVVSHSILSPCDVFECLFTHSPRLFERYIACNPRAFWDKVDPQDPKLAFLEDMIEVPNWKDKAIPYVIHGDKASFTTKNGQSLLVISWQSLLAIDFADAIFMITSMVSSIMLKKAEYSTGHNLWKAIVHEFNGLYDGVHTPYTHTGQEWPLMSHKRKLAGQEICGGKYFGVCWGFCGDLDYHCNELGTSHFNSNKAVCNACPANRSDIPFTDVSPNAAFKCLIFCPNNCRAHPSLHPIWDIHGAGRWHIWFDFMHCGPLGAILYLEGGTLKRLLQFGCGTMRDRLDALWVRICELYTRLLTYDS